MLLAGGNLIVAGFFEKKETTRMEPSLQTQKNYMFQIVIG